MEGKGLEYEELNKFVGQWTTEGKILATSTSPEILISGTDTYEWLPGNFFLLHKVDVTIGDDKNETLEIIGYNKEMDQYTLQHYDNKGNSGFMHATLVKGVWRFRGDTLRFTGEFKKGDKEFSGIWEQSSDGGNWVYFMDIQLKKAEPEKESL